MNSENELIAKENVMFGHSVDQILNWANVAYIFSLAITVLLTFAIWRLSAISNRAKDELIANANKQSELAKAEAAMATERAAIANRDAASANERGAILEKQAEEARLEQERLKAQLAWRTFSENATQTIEAVLITTKGAVTIAYTGGDPEALYLAIQIANLFNRAKWQANLEPRTYPDTLFFGIFISGADNAKTDITRKAFAAAGIGFSQEQIPPPLLSYNVRSNPDVTVMVGSRPIPYQGQIK